MRNNMKKFIVVLAICILFTSCFPKTFSDLKENDYEKYLEFRIETISHSSKSSFDGSPLSYTVLKGKNALANYDWKIVSLRSWYNTYYVGDPTLLIDKLCPNSDIVLGYNNIYYVGSKKHE